MPSQINFVPRSHLNGTSSSSNRRLMNSNNNHYCGFCFQNKEPSQVYMSHQLKDSQGNVTCPQLFKHVCEVCGSTGSQAHTRSYCPNIVAMRQHLINNHNNNSTASLSNGHHKANIQQANRQVVATKQPLTKPITIENNNHQLAPRTSGHQESGLYISHDRRFRNMGQLTSSRYNSAGRLRRQPARFCL